MSGPQVKWELVGDTSKTSKAIDGAITKSESLTGKLQGVGKGMVLGAGIGAFNLLTGAVETAIGKLGEAAQAFRDDEVSQAKLGQVLKNVVPNWKGNTDAVEKYAAAQMRLGFVDDEVRDSLGQLVGVTKNVAEAQKLNTLAQDLARAKSIDLATATDIITKAHEGNGKALKGLGIDIRGAQTGAELLAATELNVKGAAETWAATNEGKLAVSNAKVGEGMEKVGKVVNAVATAVLPVLADAFVWVTDVLGQVWDALQPVIKAVAERLQPVFKALLPVARQVFGYIGDVVKALAPIFKTTFDIVGKVIEVAVALFKVEFAIIGNVINTVVNIVKSVATVVSSVFNTVGKVIKGAINGIIGAVNGIIRAINGIQIHLHLNLPDPLPDIKFDWGGLNLRQLPYLHTGGIVPGAPGQDVLTVLQAGERVLPAGSGGDTIVNIGTFIGSGRDIDRLADLIATRLRLQGA